MKKNILGKILTVLAVMALSFVIPFSTACFDDGGGGGGGGGGVTPTTTYNVVFDVNTDDTVTNEPDTAKVEEGGTVTKPTDPGRNGYTFAGWFSDKALSSEFNFSSKITKNTTLYAKWEKIVIKYDITLVYNNGSANGKITVNENTPATRPADPSKDRYAFDGWYIDEGLTSPYNFSTPVTMAFSLYAKYHKVVFDLTLDYNYTGAPAATVITTNNSGIATKPADPRRTDYTFAGWFTDRAGSTPFSFTSALTADTTVYASWTSNQAVYNTLTFNYNYDGSTNNSINVEHGTAAAKPTDPVRDGYRFLGWFKEAAGTNEFAFTTLINEDTTIFAKWEQIVYKTVTFDFNYEGSHSQEVKVEVNTTVNKPTDPARLGYTFSGWTTLATGGAAFIFTANITENVTVYAQWSKLYVYESEDTKLEDFRNGFGFSGGMSGTGCIVEDISEGYTAQASGRRFVTYLNNDAAGCELKFIINSDRAVETDLIVRMSAEVKDITITSEGDPEEDAIFEITVNGTSVGFDPISFRGVPSQSSGVWFAFRDFNLGKINLKAGENVIIMHAANSVGQGGTMYATAPMVDCIKIETTAILTWTSYAIVNYGG